MIKVLIGSVAGAVAMFVMGFLFWASPIAMIGISSTNDQQSASIQQSLASNLPGTGFYLIPNPDNSGGAVMYGKGPVATVNYNRGGFAAGDSASMIGGFVQEIVVSLMIGFSLLAVAGRVTDFRSRARLVIGLGAAMEVMVALGDPIWMHGDWRYAIYALVANLAMFVASGLVIVKWFLPRPVV